MILHLKLYRRSTIWPRREFMFLRRKRFKMSRLIIVVQNQSTESCINNFYKDGIGGKNQLFKGSIKYAQCKTSMISLFNSNKCQNIKRQLKFQKRKRNNFEKPKFLNRIRRRRLQTMLNLIKISYNQTKEAKLKLITVLTKFIKKITY